MYVVMKPACAREVAWRPPVGMDKGRGLPAGRRSSETTIKNNTDMNFIKTFLAGLLAFVGGCFPLCYIGIMMLGSLAGPLLHGWYRTHRAPLPT